MNREKLYEKQHRLLVQKMETFQQIASHKIQIKLLNADIETYDAQLDKVTIELEGNQTPLALVN